MCTILAKLVHVSGILVRGQHKLLLGGSATQTMLSLSLRGCGLIPVSFKGVQDNSLEPVVIHAPGSWVLVREPVQKQFVLSAYKYSRIVRKLGEDGVLKVYSFFEHSTQQLL